MKVCGFATKGFVNNMLYFCEKEGKTGLFGC